MQVWVAITRASHQQHKRQPSSLGKVPVAANAPRYPHVATERWCDARGAASLSDCPVLPKPRLSHSL